MIWWKVSTVSCFTRNPGEDKLRITFTFILTLTFLYWVLSVGGVHILLMKRKGRITSPANWILFCFQDFTFQRKVLFCTKAKYKKPLFGCGFDTEDKTSCLLQIRESVVECWMEFFLRLYWIGWVFDTWTWTWINGLCYAQHHKIKPTLNRRFDIFWEFLFAKFLWGYVQKLLTDICEEVNNYGHI